jgi:hypothetical protein
MTFILHCLVAVQHFLNLVLFFIFCLESSPVATSLKLATVIFLYVYPDFLVRLLPLLSRLTTGNSAATRLIATITYHIPDRNAVVEAVNSVNDIKLYSKVVT